MNASMPGEPRKPGEADDGAAPSVAAYYGGMDKRLAILEMRFDIVLPTLATKADLAELRTEILTAQEKLRSEILNAMLELQRKLLMSIVGTMVAMFLGMVGLFVSISSTMMETTDRMVQTHVRANQDARDTQPAPPNP